MTADEFNQHHEIGDPVALILDNGTVIKTTLRTKAWTLGHRAAVAMVKGKSGGWSVSRIRKLSGEDDAAS